MPTFGLKIPQLPKSEYRLMKGLIEYFELFDQKELLAVGFILMYRLLHAPDGEAVIVEVIDDWRAMKKKAERDYPFPKKFPTE